MTPNFFSRALREAMEKRHFNQAQLADFLQVDPAYVSRWLKGSSPRLAQMRSVLETLGWDIDRARPDYDPFADAIGRVAPAKAGKGSGAVAEGGKGYASSNPDEVRKILKDAAEVHRQLSRKPVPEIAAVKGKAEEIRTLSGKEAVSVDDMETLFTTPEYAGEELMFVRVENDLLAPAFPPGTRLAVRRVTKPALVPAGAIVVLEPAEQDGSGFIRRLIRVEEKEANRVDRIVGLPLSGQQDYLFFKPREATIAYVVVGSVQPASN